MNLLKWFSIQGRIYNAVEKLNSNIESYLFQARALNDTFNPQDETWKRERDEISSALSSLDQRKEHLLAASPLGWLYNMVTETNYAEFDRY